MHNKDPKVLPACGLCISSVPLGPQKEGSIAGPDSGICKSIQEDGSWDEIDELPSEPTDIDRSPYSTDDVNSQLVVPGASDRDMFMTSINSAQIVGDGHHFDSHQMAGLVTAPGVDRESSDSLWQTGSDHNAQ